MAALDGPGLYLLVFDGKQTRRDRQAYGGQTGNVRERIRQHRLAATMLGVDVDGYEVWVHPMPRTTSQQRRPLEYALHDRALPLHVLTNQRRELEAEVMGAGWH